MFNAYHVPHFMLISDDGQLFAEKTPRHVENVIMMFNHAVNACPVHGVLYVKLRKIYRTLLLQCTNSMYTLMTVTSLSNNFTITKQLTG